MGDFQRIMNVAKRELYWFLSSMHFLIIRTGAKRIGLMFSSAQIDYNLDPRFIADIPDITLGDELFSDGCGLMSRRLAIPVSKAKRIIFRGIRYTPTVFQIRYLLSLIP